MVYVDDLKSYKPKSGLWCHMMTDSSDPEELHEMAARIGLKRSWFQNHPVHPHYDLRKAQREMAIQAGARPVSSMELVRFCSKLSIGKNNALGQPAEGYDR